MQRREAGLRERDGDKMEVQEKRGRRVVSKRMRMRMIRGKQLTGSKEASRDEKRYETYIAVIIGTH